MSEIHRPYNPANWYWIVQDKNPLTTVFSSASRSYVPVNNATYVAWLVYHRPTKIDTEAALKAVLLQARVGFAGAVTEADIGADKMTNDPFIRAMVQEFAARFGVSTAVLVNAIKARL